MLYALAFAALTAVPAQGGQLKLTNSRMSYGELGPVRTNAKFLPGDVLFFACDMNGITIEPNGDAKFKMETKVLDSTGKVIFKRDPEERDQITPLRGNVLPARAVIIIGLDQPAGQYTLEITVEDPKTKAKDTATTKFEVLKRDFGIVNVYTSYDVAGYMHAPNSGVVGQTLFLQYTVPSFGRDPKTKQPKIEFQYQFLDDKGTPLLPEPQKFPIDNGVDEKHEQFTDRFPIFLNRPGKFTVQITATDKVANKKSTFDLVINSHNPN
jgi:hypothetical protein